MARPIHGTTAPPQRRRLLVAGVAALVLCAASAGGLIWSRNGPAPAPPVGAPPLGAPPPQLRSAPALPSASPPALAPTGPSMTPAPSNAAASRSESANRAPLETLNRPADALATWAAALRLLDIPPVALQSYGYAEAVLATTKPRCQLSWTLLAGIGAVESNHGRYGGAALRPDGTSSNRIIGVPLVGVGTERVPDTDGGLLDSDRTIDRAIGAMQFLPATWRSWAIDADHDGRSDPYDIDDAALAAANYLCAGGQSLASGPGWSAAVFSYNRNRLYVERVFNYADAYGRAS